MSASTRTLYLLPCSCGKTLPVDRSQAGLTLHCECGADLIVPTLRGIEKLERAPVTSDQPVRPWNARKGAFFLGGFLFLLGFLATVLLWIARPQFPQEYFDGLVKAAGETTDLDQMPFSHLNDLWRNFKNYEDYTPSPEYHELATIFNALVDLYHRRIRLSVGVTVAGIIVLGIGMLLPKTQSSRGASVRK